MLYQRNGHNVTAFFEENLTFNGGWRKLRKMSETDVARMRSRFNRIKKQFVFFCAGQGLFDLVFTPHQLEEAQKKGVLPENYDIHHIVPLSFGGSNARSNLCVIHKMAHDALHRYYWNMIGKNWNPETHNQAYVYLPVNIHFISENDLSLFFSPADANKIKKEYKRRLRAIAARAKWKNESKKQKKTVCHCQKVPSAALEKRYKYRQLMMKRGKGESRKKAAHRLGIYKKKGTFRPFGWKFRKRFRGKEK